MIVKYKIEVPNELSADFWKLLTENLNVILIKHQHTIDGKTLYIDAKIIGIKVNNI